jgi:membrane-associated phospholipid phosphatase
VRLAPDRARQGDIAAAVGAATIATFWAVSISLYLNRSWTHPIARACRADNGRDWMLNSGVLKLDHRRAGPLTHAISAALFATYPLWLWLGWRDGRRRG